MADYNVKIHLQWNGQGVHEQLYWSGGGGSGLNQVTEAIKNMIAQRRACLASDWTVTGISIDEMLPFQQQRMLYGEPYTGRGTAPIPVLGVFNTTSCSELCVLLRFAETTFRWKRSYWMHGIPANAIKSPDITKPVMTVMEPAFLDNVRRWVALLGITIPGGPTPRRGAWALLASTNGLGGPVTRFPVPAVGLRNGFFEVNVDGDFAPANGTKVHLHGFSGCTLKGLNGDHTVTASRAYVGPPAGNTLTLDVRQCCLGEVTSYNKQGSIYEPFKEFQVLTDGAIARLVLRKLGKADLEARGRARKRACAC